MTAKEIFDLHESLYGAGGVLVIAPGRVNLIGEHTDYSEGFVMPAAIDFSTMIVMSPRSDGRIRARSVNYGEDVDDTVEALIASKRGHWMDYPAGVLWALGERGIALEGGFNMTMSGDVPLGAGLSSSASVEVAAALALLQLAKKTVGRDLELRDVAKLCQRTENGFVGANSGIMDQFIVCFGRQDHALLLDCRTLEFELAPMPPDVRMVICNSMVKHSHADGAYNTRRGEIEAGLAILRRHRPEIAALRDATMDDLAQWGAEMPETVMRRCRHVITEDARVLDAAAAFRRGDLVRFGELMHQAQDSFRDDFEASCPEIDVLITLAERQPGCFGARMTGGGFGGCTVNLVETDAVTPFVTAMRAGYLAATGIAAEIYVCRASDGAHQESLA